MTTDVDLLAEHLEITQGIQDLSNSVELIADRRTYVRGHVRAVGGSASNIATKFTVRRGDDTYGPYNALNNPITVYTNPDRAQVNHSFLVELPSAVLKAGEMDVCMTINDDRTVEGYDYTNDRVCKRVSLETGPPVGVRFYRVS
ncbi:MAG: hypothetical protein N3C12_07280 [Candidatus Binatia bacterium]|nr:hypothetical protein [Candidatus Binatia bacterium]